MPTDYTIEEISRFRFDIESDVRHELEHSGQTTQDLMSVQSKIKTEEDIWKSLQNAWDYYSSQTELPAHAAGWVLKAKRTRQSVYDVIYQQLYRIYATGIDVGYSEKDMSIFMNKLSNLYYNYIDKRWNKNENN
jgi:hypothetical protein